MLHITVDSVAGFVARDIAVPEPLIDPWMAPGSVTLLFGPPSAGKTHLTLSMARALVAGTPLWDTFATRKSRILLVQADMNTALYQERIRFHADALADATVLTTDAMPLDVCKMSANEPAIVQARAIAPDVIFVDSLRKSHSFDENDSVAPDRVYAAWRTLFPGAALVFLHHTRKLPTSPDASKVLSEAFRGSGAWAASADTLIVQRRVRKANNPAWMTRISFVRTRSCEEPASVLLRLTENLLLETLSETPTERSLLAWIGANPRATRAEAVQWLVREGHCSQATAYRTWDRVIRGETNANS